MNTIAGPPGSPVYVPWPCPVCLRGGCTGGTGCTKGRRSGRWSFLLALVLLAGCQQINWLDDPKWDHAPISFDYSAMGPVFDSSFSAANGAWNYAAGCRVAVKAGLQPSAADVMVSPYDGTACGRDANLEATGDATAGFWRCSPTHAEIKFKEMTDIRSVFVIAAHEWGHALGFAHMRSELMNPSPPLYDPQKLGQPRPLNESPGLMPLPSDAEGKALRQRYCR